MIMEGKYRKDMYRKVDFGWGDTLDKAVELLLTYKEKGVLAYGIFNGKTLYSDTVTMKDAYLEIVVMSKEEFDKQQKESVERYEEEKRKHKENIPRLVEEWKKKGKEVLEEKYLDEWVEILPVRLNDLYRGMELGCCLDIVSILNNNGTFEEAKAKLDSQDHSGTSYGLVCVMVKNLCSRGNDFVSYVRKK